MFYIQNPDHISPVSSPHIHRYFFNAIIFYNKCWHWLFFLIMESGFIKSDRLNSAHLRLDQQVFVNYSQTEIDKRGPAGQNGFN